MDELRGQNNLYIMVIIPVINEERVHVTIPTERTSSGVVTLRLHNSATHDDTDAELSVSADAGYSIEGTIQPSELAPGQYTYTVFDGEGVIGRGLAQVGLVPPSRVKYKAPNKPIVYER